MFQSSEWGYLTVAHSGPAAETHSAEHRKDAANAEEATRNWTLPHVLGFPKLSPAPAFTASAGTSHSSKVKAS